MQKNGVIYYKDELNDDFSDSNIEPIVIDENYKYIHNNPIWKISAFIVYRIIMLVPTYIYTRIKYGITIKNRKVIKKAKTGFFIYGNHTQEIIDTFTPTYVSFPKRVYVITHPDNVSIKGMKILNRLLGAIPIPGNMKSSKNFLETIKYYIEKNKVITVYPEAHIWPFYTKIRPYKSVSFKYPVELNVPAYAFTTTYIKNKNKVKMVVYVDGPFYPDKNLNKKEAQEKLRNQIYEAMCKRSKNNNVEVIKYEKEKVAEKEEIKIYD